LKKVLGIAGSMKLDNSSSEYLLSVALDACHELGIETEMIRLKDYHILPCDGCGNCMDNKRCHLLLDDQDQFTSLFEKMAAADGFIFASPVYALSLPAIWKNWIDRCEPCSQADLNYDHYNYDRVADIKGKALRGKVAGQIVVSAGPGHEWALSSMLPAFTAVKLSVVASVGISLIEYDGQPGIQKQPWAKAIQDADFAKMMAKAVGIRVATALGYSTFDLAPKKNAISCENIGEVTVFDYVGKAHQIKELGNNGPAVLVLGNQQVSERCQYLFKQLETVLSGYGKCYLAAVVGELPPFITKDFVKERVCQNIDVEAVLFDWDNQIGAICGIQSNPPVIYLRNLGKEKLIIDQTDDGTMVVEAVRSFLRSSLGV
jgi:multimeric flavodoxin WrbA